ncbi:hypothetical protein D3C72_1950720 [compost metagenome]
MDRTGWTGFHAGRLLTHAHAIHAQRAFVYPVIVFVQPRNVERTTRDTVAAANAVILLEIDDTIGVLNNGPRRRTRFQAPRIFTLHTAVFADQPLQLAVLVRFAKAHHRPGFGAQIRGIIVNPHAVPNLIANVIPL